MLAPDSALETALAVLRAITDRVHPAIDDIAALRRHATAAEARLPIDELACAIITRELAARRARGMTA